MAKIYFGMYAEFIVGASHGNEKRTMSCAEDLT